MTEVSRSRNIELTLSEAISVDIANATNIIVTGSLTGIITATYSGGEGTVITIDPTTDFKPRELITVTLLTGLQLDATNEALSNTYTIQFRTGAATINYYSLSTAPIKTTIETGTNVYLEDREANIFTCLDETNASYTVTLNTALNGIGRFYIHTTDSTLSIGDTILDNVGIYKTSKTNLRIAGIQTGKASLAMYTMLGKQVLTFF